MASSRDPDTIFTSTECIVPHEDVLEDYLIVNGLPPAKRQVPLTKEQIATGAAISPS
jgi:hypothetical protein